MQFDFAGKTWDFNREAITVDQWRELKRKYRMTPKQFEEGFNEADPDALTFAWWVLLHQNGTQNVTLGDHLRFDAIGLHTAMAEALNAEAEARQAAEAEPDPTASFPPAPSPVASPPSPATPGLALSPNGQEGAAQITVS